MKLSPKLVPAAALAALILPIGAGWLVHRADPPVYEAAAALLIAAGDERNDGNNTSAATSLALERDVLSPEVIAQSLDLLESRRITVSPDPVRLSLSDILLDRLHVDPPAAPGSQEVVVRYRTLVPDEAVGVLSAVLDAAVELSNSRSLTKELSESIADDETELAQLNEAVTRQRGLVTAAERRVQELSAEDAAHRAQLEKIKSLGQAVADAHRIRIEAENRYQQAERDVAAGVPAELLAARLPAGELRNAVNQLFTREERRRELTERQQRLQQLAAVYGRNHPVLREVRARIEELNRDLSHETHPVEGTADLTREQLVLQALRGAWNEAQASEEDLQNELAAETAVVDDEQAAAQSLAEHRDELTFLETERARVQQRLDRRRRAVAASAASIARPAALNPEPVSPGPALSLSVGAALGTLCCVGILWRAARRRRHEKERTGPRQSRASYRRFLSHEERQLVRMKTSAAGAG